MVGPELLAGELGQERWTFDDPCFMDYDKPAYGF